MNNLNNYFAILKRVYIKQIKLMSLMNKKFIKFKKQFIIINLTLDLGKGNPNFL